MKHFFAAVVEWKTWAALCFAGATVIHIVVALFLGQSEIAIRDIISLLLISSIGTFIQYLAFGPRIIKHMRYTFRMIIFAVPFLALLIATAYSFQWFPSDNRAYWLTFIGIYLLAFAGMTVSFEIYFHASGKKYDGLLGQYRKRLEEGKK
jgi:hypothetical protein